MNALIENHRVIVCTGSGGVGKTTTSAALGVAAARAGKRVLVLTIDPARRLATTLGIARRSDDVRVPLAEARGEFWAGMIDPPRIFADYIRQHATDDTALQLFGNSLYQQLSTTLSGSQEFTSLSRLHDAVASGRYDLVILDTPPAAHAAEFLTAPQRLNAVFDSTVVSLFMGRAPGFGLAAAAWKQGFKVLLGTLRLLTGSAFVGQFSHFFAAIDAIAPAIRETNLAAHQLLLDPATAFVLVTSHDAAKLQEGRVFHDALVAAGYHLRQVIVNRAWPLWMEGGRNQQATIAAELAALDRPDLQALHTTLRDYYSRRARIATPFDSMLAIPEFDDDIVGLPALERLADRLSAQR